MNPCLRLKQNPHPFCTLGTPVIQKDRVARNRSSYELISDNVIKTPANTSPYPPKLISLLPPSLISSPKQPLCPTHCMLKHHHLFHHYATSCRSESQTA
ncbi:hypothetical protein CEXT_595301 [Caerostris extrusa]|uniref:Uncharacterized protein n=1 Tax=Caerostris extrusa TaxID=172846 RepID=A0AAV4US05_CAEEX|nr:hypothetical protein CEXT_595301 [Caerostris extrusa]